MNRTPYARFNNGDLILRDELAIDRTLLANERTLLAYWRSGVALVIAGISILHFATGGGYAVLGAACIPAGLAAGLVGWVRYRRMDRSIRQARRPADDPGAGPTEAA